MARRRKIAPTPLVRNQVRAAVRRGSSTDVEIASEVNNKFAGVNGTALNTLIRQERKRQLFVDKITKYDKRRNVDLKELTGCKGKDSHVRASITLVWYDQTAEIYREYGTSLTLADKGRMADIINEAIQTVTKDALSRGYTIPTITSADKGGDSFYRFEFVECT